MFTEYDGYVPAAGQDNDPTAEDGPAVSPSRLEKLAACPIEYFFNCILQVEPPEEYQYDPDVWLNPPEKGELLHEVFRAFLASLAGRNLAPDLGRDWKILESILQAKIEEKAREQAPPGPQVFARERRELAQIARIFLKEEAERASQGRPRYLEAAIGMIQRGQPTPLDTPDPVAIPLPNGKIIRVRGKIDRIDELTGSSAQQFMVWDYKTGSKKKYENNPPFNQGRCIQNFFYLALAMSRLAKVHPGSAVSGFGYFFPTLQAHGERMEWSSEELEAGRRVAGALCEMIGRGCFPFTTDHKEARYNDYLAAFGDIEQAAREINAKMADQGNPALAPFRELRVAEPDEKPREKAHGRKTGKK